MLLSYARAARDCVLESDGQNKICLLSKLLRDGWTLTDIFVRRFDFLTKEVHVSILKRNAHVVYWFPTFSVLFQWFSLVWQRFSLDFHWFSIA